MTDITAFARAGASPSVVPTAAIPQRLEEAAGGPDLTAPPLLTGSGMWVAGLVAGATALLAIVVMVATFAPQAFGQPTGAPGDNPFGLTEEHEVVGDPASPDFVTPPACPEDCFYDFSTGGTSIDGARLAGVGVTETLRPQYYLQRRSL